MSELKYESVAFPETWIIGRVFQAEKWEGYFEQVVIEVQRTWRVPGSAGFEPRRELVVKREHWRTQQGPDHEKPQRGYYSHACGADMTLSYKYISGEKGGAMHLRDIQGLELADLLTNGMPLTRWMIGADESEA